MVLLVVCSCCRRQPRGAPVSLETTGKQRRSTSGAFDVVERLMFPSCSDAAAGDVNTRRSPSLSERLANDSHAAPRRLSGGFRQSSSRTFATCLDARSAPAPLKPALPSSKVPLPEARSGAAAKRTTCQPGSRRSPPPPHFLLDWESQCPQWSHKTDLHLQDGTTGRASENQCLLFGIILEDFINLKFNLSVAMDTDLKH